MIDEDVLQRMLVNEADMAFKRRVRTIFEWIQPRDGDLVLDVPCGRGYYLKMLRNLVAARLVGVDIDPAALRIASGVLGKDANIALHCANVCQLPFADNSFDKVILSEGLEHVRDDGAAMDEVYRVTSSGGTVAITVPHSNYPFLWDPVNRTLEFLFGTHVGSGVFAGIWANHVRLYDRDSLYRVVRNAGFLVEAERSFTHHCFPFSHNLVYGLGKTLLDHGMLTASTARLVDRATLEAEPAHPLHPFRLALSILGFFDRNNSMEEPPGRATVSLCIRARKPGHDGWESSATVPGKVNENPEAA